MADVGIITGPIHSEIKESVLHSAIKSSRFVLVPCCGTGFLYKAEITSVGAANTVWFGVDENFALGCYLVKTCSGAWNFGGLDPSNAWVVSRAPTGFESPPGSQGHFVKVLYDDGDSTAVNNEAVPGTTGYSSQLNAERAACGKYATFRHQGGKIGVRFEEFYYTDNSLGTRNPTYALYRIYPPCPELISIYWNYSGGGVYTITVGLRNNSTFCALHAHFTLSADEAISVSPDPNPDAIPPLTTNYLTFQCTADPVGTVEFNNVRIATDRDDDDLECADLVTSCAPILNNTASSRSGGDIYCSGLARWQGSFSIKNNGNSDTINLVATVTAVSGAEIITGWSNCTVLSSLAISFGKIATTATVSKDFYFKASSSVAIFNVALSDGTSTFPGFQLQFNV